MRAGGYALSLLGTPGVVSVLGSLAGEPMTLADLRRAIGSPPQSTLRGQLRELSGLGVLGRRREYAFPRSVQYELTESGRDLLAAAETLQSWLDDAPEPVRLGDIPAKRVVKALSDGWEAGLVRLLAAEPRSLTELSHEIPSLSYPSIERRLTAMRALGLVETLDSNGQGAPCRPTLWLRRAAVPLAAASRFEHTRVAKTHDAKVDIQALLMLVMPIVDFPKKARGAATLVTRQRQRQEGKHPVPEAITVEIRDGQSQRCVALAENGAKSWAIGAPDAWLDAVLDGAVDRLRIGGSGADFAEAVVGTLHSTLRMRKPPEGGL